MIEYSGGSVTASFLYDGDGKRVQATVNGVTTQFVGSQVEWQSSTTDMLRYYYTGGVRVAMRTGDDGLVWLVGDHLGSTSIAVTDASGATERQGYKAWGETRFGSLPTKYQYTGQRNEPALGMYYYGARWYDSELGRFSQADTVIPDPYNSLDYDRYQYVRSNPIRYSDPTGNFSEDQIKQYLKDKYGDDWYDYYLAWLSDKVFWEMLRKAQGWDTLSAPTTNLGTGQFVPTEDGGFTFSGQSDLYQYQGFGPYFLNDQSPLPNEISHHPLGNADLGIWTQPLYDYSSGVPKFAMYERTVRYKPAGWEISIKHILNEGDSLPWIATNIVSGVIYYLGEGLLTAYLSGGFFAVSLVGFLNNITDVKYVLTIDIRSTQLYITAPGVPAPAPFCPIIGGR
jgi:RHS repeat-associated protein